MKGSELLSARSRVDGLAANAIMIKMTITIRKRITSTITSRKENDWVGVVAIRARLTIA